MGNLFYYLRRLWWSLAPNKAPLTTLIVVLNIVVYIYQLWVSRQGGTWLEDLLSLSRPGMMHHQYWQLLSYAWLHDVHNPFHLILNMMVILVMGQILEWSLGPWRFLVLYIGGGVAAGLAWLFFGEAGINDAIIGASGAAYALITASGSFDPNRKVQLVFLLNLTLQNLVILAVISEFIMLHYHILPGFAHMAHLGGAAYGWLIMKVWRIRADHYYPAGGRVSRL